MELTVPSIAVVGLLVAAGLVMPLPSAPALSSPPIQLTAGESALDAASAGDLLNQAVSDLTHLDQLLAAAPTDALAPSQLQLLLTEQSFVLQQESFVVHQAAIQAALPDAEQNLALLFNADQVVLNAANDMLAPVQNFVAADEAGDLSSQASAFTVDMGLLQAEWGFLPGVIDMGLATLTAQFADDFGLSWLLSAF